MISKDKRRQKLHWRIRKTVKGTAECPRLSVFRSNKAIYAQLIDDVNGVTLASASSRSENLKSEKGTKSEISAEVGKSIASAAKGLNISQCRFDRGGYLYHGRVKALADGAREGGLQF